MLDEEKGRESEIEEKGEGSYRAAPSGGDRGASGSDLAGEFAEDDVEEAGVEDIDAGDEDLDEEDDLEDDSVVDEEEDVEAKASGKPKFRIRRYSQISEKNRCRFCREKVKRIDYKDVLTLQKLCTTQGRIFSRKRSGNCARHQRMVKIAIKRARFMALMSYVG